jgi:hypothetical protein
VSIQDTERELCGAALDDPRITAAIHLEPAQFESPSLGAIWHGIRAVHQRGLAPTATLVLDEAQRTGVRVDPLILPALVGAGMAVNADRYAERIADAHRRRGIADTILHVRQQLDQGAPTDQIVADLSGRLEVVSAAEEDAEDLLNIDEFVDQDLPPESWIIPGLFSTGERAIVTGDEGAGKSMLMRQMGLCAAAGLHPFTYDHFRPVRVLIVDAENPKPIMVRKFRSIRDELAGRGLNPGERCWVKRYPQGMDLSQSRDRLALHNLCMLTRPELLIIGPAYKLYVGGGNAREEDLARQVTSVLDGLREEFGFALMLEHHSPHESGVTGKRSPRPIGSSLWRRWPEYGFGLVLTSMTPHGRTVELRHWRGMRDDRPWPSELQSSGRLPWAVADAYEAAQLRSIA